MTSLGMEIYRQCHEHLRDADKKRDQLIGFYAIVVGLVFTTCDKVSAEQLPLVWLMVGLVGLFVALTVINYRKWHLLYSLCFEVLQDVNPNSETIASANITVAWTESLRRRREPWYRIFSLINPLAGTEAAIYDALVVLTFLPWYFVIQMWGQVPAPKTPSDLYSFLLDFILYALVMNLVALMVFMYHDAKSPFDNWILRSFRDRVSPASTLANAQAPLRIYLVVSGIIFFVIGCMHAIRLWLQLHIEIVGWVIPISISWVGLPAAFALAIWAFIILRQEH